MKRVREHQHVQELVNHMNHRLRAFKGNVQETMASLVADEIRAIQDELARVSGPDPASVRYFLSNYFFINTKGEDEAQELQAIYPFKETQEILWDDFVYCWEHKIRAWWILLKARQIGWSTLVQAILFQRTIFNPLMKVLVIADELGRAQNIFDMSLLAYNYLPFWMRPEKQYDNRGKGILHFDRKDDEQRIANPGLNSTFHVDAANKPSGSSRGFTLHGAHISEFGLFLRPKIVTRDIIPAIAKRNPLVVVAIEGTANQSQNDAYQRMWHLATRGKGLFRPLFAAWWKEVAYCKPMTPSEFVEFAYSDEETELAAKVKDEFGHELTKPQMAWYRDQADQFEATDDGRDMMEQEYPSYAKSAFRASGVCYFKRKQLDHIEVRDVRAPGWFGDMVFREEEQADGKKKEAPVFVKYPPDMMGAAPLWIWEWPAKGEVYYGASDPSQGIPGKDNSAISFFRVPLKTGERIRQCAEYQGMADPKMLAKMVCALGRLYNTAELAPEVNTLTEHIANIRHIHEYPRIYRWRKPDKVNGGWTNYWGWETSFKSRNDLLARFNSLLMENSLHLRSQRLLDECRNFIDDGTDRFEAAEGTHDDLLFSGMICVYCLFEQDPNLFRIVEADKPDPTRNAQNTDVSLFDDDSYNNRDTDYACL